MNLPRKNWTASDVIMLLAGMLLLCALVVLYFFDPAERGFFPVCIFHSVTGLNCPGCGGLRATHQLLHAHFETAFRLNPLFVVALPLAAVFFARPAFQKLRGEKISVAVNPAWLWIGMVALIVFGVVRNLPFAPFAWMSQLPQ